MKYEDAISLIKSMPNGDKSRVDLELVSENDIAQCEMELGKSVPDALKDLWRAIGYGAFKMSLKGRKKTPFLNRLMDTGSVVDTYRTYSEEYGDSIPFFDVSDEDYLLIEPDGWIRHSAADDMLVARSVRDFVERLADDPEFWASGDYLVRENAPDAR